MKKTYPILTFLALLCWGCEKDMQNFTGEGGFSPQGDTHNEFEDNPFIEVSSRAVSTFSIDADGGSYSYIRRFVNNQSKPPKAAVRIEELLNFFPCDYNYQPSQHPLSVNGEIAGCPWTSGHKLIRIGMIGRPLPSPRPPSNIVLLIDVSGSMKSADKLPLLQSAFEKLVNQLEGQDKISIVTYAGDAGMVLSPTAGNEKDKILTALQNLQAGGGTAGEAGIELAYELATENLLPHGNNRIILGTDGDFNVGVSSEAELLSLIESKRDQGVFLTVCGVGSGNFQEGKMEQLANHGNGTYEYLDSDFQSEKIFVQEFNKFFTVAQDVKVQVEFNPVMVKSYRLIGYENRGLEEDEFNNDSTDAGELGAGQTVTALYEIIPAEGAATKNEHSYRLDFRYKEPGASVANEISLAVYDEDKNFNEASENFKFAAATAAFGMILRDSPYKGNATYGQVKLWLNSSSAYDPHGYRSHFYKIVEKCENL